VYNVKKEGSTARTVAAQTLAKPSVQMALAQYAQKAEDTLIEVMAYSKEYGRTKSQQKGQGSAYAAVAARIADSVLDRVHGKAKQSIDVTSTSVNLNIDLS
jgi:hypothetical protein